VDAVKPANVILVHGEVTEMQRLHHALAPKVPGRTVMPGNAEAVELRFNDDHTVAVMGRLVRAGWGGGGRGDVAARRRHTH
jgi:hypothetical protein